jgi:hypothetical protein
LRTASLAASSASVCVAAHGRLRLRGLRLVRARLVAQPRHLARLRAATQPGRLRVGARELGLRLGTLGLESLDLCMDPPAQNVGELTDEQLAGAG